MKVIHSGGMMEAIKYRGAKGGRKLPRAQKGKPSTEARARLNEQEAWARLVRLMNCNFFRDRGDLFMVLTHEDEPDEETAKRRVSNFFRRVQYYRDKHGMTELKYICVDERQGQWHHHMMMSAMDADTIRELWGHGNVRVELVDDRENYRDTARYFLQADKPPKGDPEADSLKSPREKGKRRWRSSQNLDQPVIEVREIPAGQLAKPPKAPKGYRLLPDWKMWADDMGNIHQRYTCVRADGKKGKVKKHEGTRRKKRKAARKKGRRG
ncbi:MAG: hypothetical protein RR296_13005 [Clostridia bacterium]